MQNRDRTYVAMQLPFSSMINVNTAPLIETNDHAVCSIKKFFGVILLRVFLCMLRSLAWPDIFRSAKKLDPAATQKGSVCEFSLFTRIEANSFVER